MADKRTAESSRLAGLQFEEKQYKVNLTRRQQFLDDYNERSSQAIDRHALGDHLDRQLKLEQKRLMEQRLSYEQNETNLQQDLDRFREQRIKLESTIKLKSSQVEKNLREMQEIKQQQKQIDQYLKQLNDLDKRIQRKEEEYQEKLTGGINIDQLKVDINRDEQQRAKLQMDLKDLNEEMNKLLANSKMNTELDMFKKDKAERDEQIRKM